jgi:uncharacterized protein YcfJ
MKRIVILSVTLTLVLACLATAQSPVNEPTGQKTLAATMNVYAFPAEGQAADQQNKDEAECYTWAVNNIGTDPFQLAKQAEQQQQQAQAAKGEVSQAGKGSAAKGALVGAAGGALIGEIASDDAGRGAAIGAVVGGLGGRRVRRQKQNQATGQIDQQAAQQQAATAQQVEDFKKAFSVCLEAKDYLVKF